MRLRGCKFIDNRQLHSRRGEQSRIEPTLILRPHTTRRMTDAPRTPRAWNIDCCRSKQHSRESWRPNDNGNSRTVDLADSRTITATRSATRSAIRIVLGAGLLLRTWRGNFRKAPALPRPVRKPAGRATWLTSLGHCHPHPVRFHLADKQSGPPATPLKARLAYQTRPHD